MAFVRGAQHPETQSTFLLHSLAHVALAPPLAVTHLDGKPLPRQQSSSSMHELPAATHVFWQKPRGAQTLTLAFESFAQQPELHEEPDVQALAHRSG